MKDLNTILGIIGIFIMGIIPGSVIGYKTGEDISKNKVIEGYTVKVKYQTNSLGEVTIVSRNWVKNEN